MYIIKKELKKENRKMLTLENKKELIKLLKEEKNDYQEDYNRIVNSVSRIYTDIDSLHDFGYDYIESLMSCSEEATKFFDYLQWAIDFEKFVWHNLMHTNKYIYLEKSRIVVELE